MRIVSLRMENPFKTAVEEAMKSRGHATILVAGRTGAGKSTLINAVFSGDLAATGQGRPVTRTAHEYTAPNSPLTLIDSRGLELGDFEDTLGTLRKLVQERRQSPDAGRHVHCAWICIAEDARRVERGESDLAAMLTSEGVPVLGVITKHRSDKGFRADVQSLLPGARNVISVRALEERFDDDETMRLPQKGLVELVELTMSTVPEGQRTALVAAQKVSLELKQRAARSAIAAAATAAAAVAFTPIPTPHAFVLLPIQIGMLARINVAFGLSFDEASLGTLVSGAVGGGLAVMAGRELARLLLSLVPGGNVINAGVAGSITTALGEAYVRALMTLLTKRSAQELSPELLGEALGEALRAA